MQVLSWIESWKLKSESRSRCIHLRTNNLEKNIIPFFSSPAMEVIIRIDSENNYYLQNSVYTLLTWKKKTELFQYIFRFQISYKNWKTIKTYQSFSIYLPIITRPLPNTCQESSLVSISIDLLFLSFKCSHFHFLSFTSSRFFTNFISLFWVFPVFYIFVIFLNLICFHWYMFYNYLFCTSLVCS